MKDHILSLIRPEAKNIFGLHDPIGLRYLFQLRVGLSPLRYHKNRHNFHDTPSNICLCKNGIEDTSHFLFSCPFYLTKRTSLFSGVNEILRKKNLNYLENCLELYLYGNHSLNLTDNKEILFLTIKFIKESGRFAT